MKEAEKTVKQMAKDYKRSKLRVEFYPKKRPTLLFKQAMIDLSEYQTSGVITYRNDRVAKYPESDRLYIAEYLYALRSVYLLEHAIPLLPYPTTREVAKFTLLDGKSCAQVAKLRFVSERAVYKSKQRALAWIARFGLQNDLMPEEWVKAMVEHDKKRK